MRAGVFISGISHVVLVALALLGTPRLFDNPPLRAIEVDLVRPEEADLPKERPPEEKPKDNKPAAFDPFFPQAADPPPQPAAKTQPKQTAPSPNQQAMDPQIPSPAPAPLQPATPWIFDPVNIPALLNLPNAPEKGFDSEAITTAN